MNICLKKNIKKDLFIGKLSEIVTTECIMLKVVKSMNVSDITFCRRNGKKVLFSYKKPRIFVL